MQRVRVRADLMRDLLNWTRPFREGVRDAELTDNGESPRRDRAAHQIPQDRLRLAPSPTRLAVSRHYR